MRIYFIGQKGIPTIAGGIEKHVEMLALELVSQGHEVFVYTRPYYTDPNLREYKGVKLISLPTIKRKNLDAIYHTLRATLHVLRQDADIIHYQGIGPSLLCWIPKLFKRRAKVVSTVHSDDRQHDKWSRFAKFMLGLGARIACRAPDATIAIAKYQKVDFEKEFGGSLVYIPNGVHSAKRIAPHAITQKWGLAGNDYILFVSRFVPHKGLHHLIEAYNQIEHCNKKLVIVGGSAHTDEYTSRIEAMARKNSNIILCGFVSGDLLLELYSNA
ncbi:glycosyltransferase family 4 protein, partial [Candidatus Falkowbacteria bacterium]|nr:glycosyltransferase family 4 protein [Candidatus Falkowbacteria bacterium]